MKRILIAEDERTIANFMRELLKQEGYLVDVVHTGADALLSIQQRAPDLLILDIGMPVMTGDKVLQALQGGAYARMPIIVATTDMNIGRYLQLGADFVLDKPYDIDRLLTLVSTCVCQEH